MSRIIYGTGPVSELLRRRSRDIAALYVTPTRKARPGDPVAALVADARGRGVVVEERSREELDALAGDRRHQGAVAIAGEYQYAAIEDLIGDLMPAPDAPPELLVALDGVQDPHNLGAIVRSAYLLGAGGLVIPQDRAAGVTAAVTKASAGATEHLRIAQVKNLARALGELKRAGFWLVAVASAADARPIHDTIHDLGTSVSLCLVLGAEGTGIRRLVADSCDFRAEIPMAAAGVGSFNVSVAAAIALYEVARQRRLRSSRDSDPAAP